MTRNHYPQVKIFVAIALLASFIFASVIPLIGPAILAHYSGRLQYFLEIISNLEVVLSILISQLIIALVILIFWNLLPVVIFILLTNAIISITFFFIGLKMEVRDQKNGITI